MQIRLAVVQHGDYLAARALRAAGERETYSGMFDSLQNIERLVTDIPHLIINLNAPSYEQTLGQGEYVGLPSPPRWRLLPGYCTLAQWSREIVRRVARFDPTHMLIRTPGWRALRLLEFCQLRNIPTLVLFANNMPAPVGLIDRWIQSRLVRLLNGDNVYLVGNHRPPAAEELIERGVAPHKVVAYDWPLKQRPEHNPPKQFASGVPTLLYVGSIRPDKGVDDVVDAARIARDEGFDLHVQLAGDGAYLPALRQRALEQGAPVEFLGRQNNEAVFELMRQCSIVCVPSRHDFSEGMPFVITEALSSRTPVVLSDHPVFKRAFIPGEGVRFYRSGDSHELLGVVRHLLSNPIEYQQLSLTTAQAFARMSCPVTFGELLDRWRKASMGAPSTARSLRSEVTI